MTKREGGYSLSLKGLPPRSSLEYIKKAGQIMKASTVRYPKGMKKIIAEFAPDLARLASETIAGVLKSEPDEQWDLSVKPLGAGAWGVVFPMADERFVMKITADPTEGPTVSKIMSEAHLHEHMAIIHYFALREIPKPAVFRGKEFRIYVIIAERLSQVGERLEHTHTSSTIRLFGAARAVVHERSKKRPNEVQENNLYQYYMETLGRHPDTAFADFLFLFADIDRGVLADIHLGNLGSRSVNWDEITEGELELAPHGYLVISDPGHTHIDRFPEIKTL